MLLVPTETHVELALARGHAPVRTLRGFVRESMAAWAPELELATVHATRMATRAALEEGVAFAAELPEEPAARVGFAHALDRTVGRLRRAGAHPAELRRLGRRSSDRIADVMEAVDGILGRATLFDPRGAGFEIASRLRAGAELAGSPAVWAMNVEVRGVLGWEQGDLAWLEALHARMRRAGGAGAKLVLPRLDDEDDPIAPIADDLERRWASLTDAPEIAWAQTSGSAPDTVVEARTRAGEARAIAHAVLEELERGAAPERIAIVVPELDEAALEPLRAALADARIPICEPRGRPVLGSPEARAALALLALAEGPVTRELLIEVLRAPGLHAGWWMERAGEVEAAGRAALLAHRLRELPVSVDRTGRQIAQALARAPSARADGAPTDTWMARALERVLSSIGWLRAGATLREIVRRYRELLDMLRLGSPSVAELASALRTEARGGSALALEALGEGARALRAVRDMAEAVEEGARIVGRHDAICTPRELGVEIQRALEWERAGPGPAARSGAVRIARAGELADLDLCLAVVTGLDARAYGGAEGARDPLLEEPIAAQLPAPLRPPSPGEQAAWARAELGWAIAGASRVVLTRSPSRDGEELPAPHPWVRRAVSRGARVREEPASRVAPGASRTGPRSSELVLLASGAPPAGDLAERVAVERARAAFFLDPRREAGAHTGSIRFPGSEARDHLVACVGGASSESSIPVTYVERAAGCAFAGFARRVLRVRRGDDIGESADPRERGNLVHRALRAAFEAIGPRPLDARAALERAHAAAEEELGGRGTTPLRREAIAQAVADAMRVVARALANDGGLGFAFAERRFGPGEPAPWAALEIAPAADGDPAVFVDGQIDRIDQSADGHTARVVDYKTGKPPDPAEHGRTAFQLPLYAELARRATGADCVEALYLRIRPTGAIEERPRRSDERISTVEERSEALAAARRVVVGLWQGDVAPRPIRPGVCARCEARDVCRRPAVMPIEDLEEAP